MQKKEKKIYLIGIWWIWVSAIARYYLHKWWKVFWSDSTDSQLIHALQDEWCDIIIWSDDSRITKDINLIVYTEAIPETQKEFQKAKTIGISMQKYNEALAHIVNSKKLIAITGTHGKSTTTSLTSLVLKNSTEWVNTIVGTILKEFWNKNTYFSESDYFVIEACEYKRHFLEYKPTLWIITNIELDHLDYYKDLEDYLSAYKSFLDNIAPWGFAILNGDDIHCQKLIWLRDDIHYIEIFDENFSFNNQIFSFPKIQMQIPWKHILFDAKIAYVVGHMLAIDDLLIINSLETYNGIWRRMEKIWKTKNWNLLMSDYGHHPTEIQLTLKAIKTANPEKELFVIFQPHQYNRTLELLEDFKNCFSFADRLIVPNIYNSRDTKEDRAKINSEKFVNLIHHKNKQDWKWFKNTLKIIKNYDEKNPNSSIILLLWAGDVDNLRYEVL